MARQTLDQWIAQALNDPDKDGPCTLISLVHVSGAQSLRELHSTKIQAGGTYDPLRMAKMFRGKAEAYAQDLPGVQTFNLMAFYGKPEAEAHQPFLVNMQADTATAGLSTEGPTETGMTAQRMRQSEMMFQQVYRRQEAMDQRADRLLDLLTRHNERLQHENMQAFEGIKELIMAMATKEHDRKTELLAFQRKTEERKALISMVPPLVNTIAGKDVFPQSTVDTILIDSMAEKLEPAHLEMLLPMLPAEVQGMVAARLEKTLKAKRDAEEQARKLPVYQGNPENEIEGK
jgi:hypothetical protein